MSEDGEADGEPGDPEPAEPGPGEGRPPPPSLAEVAGAAALVLVLVLSAPALYVAGRDLTGSRLLGVLGLVPPAAGVALVYRRLFR